MPETKKTRKNARKPPQAKSNGKKTCTVAGCKRAYRAKGLCYFHYAKWRRGEMEAKPRRWKACSKEECKKKVLAHGLCQEHYDAWKKSRKGAKAGAEGAAEAPATA